MVGACPYVFVKTHRMYKTKNKEETWQRHFYGNSVLSAQVFQKLKNALKKMKSINQKSKK